MSSSRSHAELPVGADLTESAAPTRGADFVSLTKPRLNFLVILTTLAAYYLGSDERSTIVQLVHTLVGTALVAGGAAALNQVWERDTDRLMARTRYRPLPDLRLSPGVALGFGLTLTVVGLAELWAFVNTRAALIAMVTTVTYILLYTPLKLRTSLSTIAGAIPGALPAVIGWAAATNSLSIEGWVLFGIVFLWQMPHFLAIAWMYRDEYARAGMPLLPVIEPDGRSTGRQALLYTAALLPISVLPTLMGMATAWYLAGAVVLGAVLVSLSLKFSQMRTLESARRLFFGSILYLPLLWAILVVDHFAH
jgi:protoheme IX farnesyltransferase